MLRTILCIVFCLTLFGCKAPKNLSSPSEVGDTSHLDIVENVEVTSDRSPIDVPNSKVFDSLEATMELTGLGNDHKACFNADVPVQGEGFSLVNCRNGCCVFSLETKDFRDSGCYEEWCASTDPCTWLAFRKPWCEEG